MIGLLVKDFMTIQRQMKSQLFVILFLLIMAILMRETSMILAVIVFIVTIKPSLPLRMMNNATGINTLIPFQLQKLILCLVNTY